MLYTYGTPYLNNLLLLKDENFISPYKSNFICQVTSKQENNLQNG